MGDTSDPTKEYLESQRILLRQQLAASVSRTAQTSRGFFTGRRLRAGGTGLDVYGTAPFPPAPPPPDSPPPNPPPPNNPPPNPPPPNPPPPNNPPPKPPKPKPKPKPKPPKPPKPPPPPPGCFVVGTPVDTPTGPVAIESLKVGDAVWTVDNDGNRVVGEVTDVHAHPQSTEARGELVLDDGRKIVGTLAHEVYHAKCGDFHRLDHFCPDDSVLEFDLDTGLPSETKVLATIRGTANPVDLYDISVSPFPHYLVQGVQVHNKCFVKGTLISTPTGPKPIESLRGGDLVWAVKEDTMDRVRAKVTAVVHHPAEQPGTHPILRVTMDDGTVFEATADHRMYDFVNGAYVELLDFEVGDSLWDGNARALVDIARIEQLDEPVDTYNIEIEKYHNYLAHGFLAHNPKQTVIANNPTKRMAAPPAPRTLIVKPKPAVRPAARPQAVVKRTSYTTAKKFR